MSCCGGGSKEGNRQTGTGCCGSNCSKGREGCLAGEERIRSCICQENVGCLDRADCGGFRPRGTAATGACPGPCQCAEEEAWNINIPPKPNCEWLANFSELRQQWSDHGRKLNCKCCSCAPTKKAAPCKPCLPPSADNSSQHLSSPRYDNRLGGGACVNSNNCSSKKNNNRNNQSSLNNLQPCAPSQKPGILKNRSCCQCIPNYCMCQAMPRACNCPPPVQIDARAERECSCECPSSPECACPPSERKFPRTKIKCPNAKLCHTPRLQPGPKCHCTECQPQLPPPCDPCTSSKCHPGTPRFESDDYDMKNRHENLGKITAGNCSSCRKKREYDSSSSSMTSPCCGTERGNYGKSSFKKIQQREEKREVKNKINSRICRNCDKIIRQIPRAKDFTLSFKFRPEKNKFKQQKNDLYTSKKNLSVSKKKLSTLKNVNFDNSPDYYSNTCCFERPEDFSCEEFPSDCCCNKNKDENRKKNSQPLTNFLHNNNPLNLNSSSSNESVNLTVNCMINLSESSSSSSSSIYTGDCEIISTMDIHCAPLVNGQP